MVDITEVIDNEKAKLLVEKIGRISKIEQIQQSNVEKIAQVVHDVDILRKEIKANGLDGRLSKVEKRQEFVLEELVEMKKGNRAFELNCDKQRTQCMAAVAPVSLVVDLKNDLKRMEERLAASQETIRNRNSTDIENSNRWTRWAFVLSMLACIVSTVSVIVAVQVITHLPK